MKAYVAFGAYRPTFDSDNFAKAVVKKQGETEFAKVLGRETKKLADGRAMYIYGGRQALLDAFKQYRATAGGFGLAPSDDDQKLAVFHGKVSAKGKTKRILMVTPVDDPLPAEIRNKQLTVQGTSGLYDLITSKNFDTLIRLIPD